MDKLNKFFTTVNWYLLAIAFVLTAAIAFMMPGCAKAPSAPPKPVVISMLAVWKCHTPVVFETLSDGTLLHFGDGAEQLTEEQKQALQALGNTLPKKAVSTAFIPCAPGEDEEEQQPQGKYRGPATSARLASAVDGGSEHG